MRTCRLRSSKSFLLPRSSCSWSSSHQNTLYFYHMFSIQSFPRVLRFCIERGTTGSGRIRSELSALVVRS